MGREIRMVPPKWEHPKTIKFNYLKQCEEESYQPLYNKSYSASMAEWIRDHQLWEKGEHPDQQGKDRSDCLHYAQWGGNPPDVEYYRPEWAEGEATWFQLYETVSEGTPVTPPFETREGLVEYLVANGDFWDQRRREEGPRGGFQMPCDPWPRDRAVAFVFGGGWAPSFVMENGAIKSGVEAVTGI